MKGKQKLISLLLVMAMVASFAVGCKSKPADENKDDKKTTQEGNEGNESNEIKEFTAYFAVPGDELPADNRIMNEIANKVGAKVKMTWLTAQNAAESIGTLIAGGEYPDFVDGSTGTQQMIDAGAYIPIDEYWDNYPNIKNHLTEAQWNALKQKDGHVYIIPQFGITNGVDTQTYHNDEAFWIQVRVLEWANYPKITTLDEYFKLIQDYLKANPKTEDGQKNIGYSILTDDWRYFCLENPPMFLDGYPNDGSCIVDPETLEARNYNTTPTAKKFFAKLNDMYKKGIVDPETFTLKYDQYIAKLSSGRVLGMVDQYWNFQNAEASLKKQKLYDHLYVPVGIVIEEGIKERYHNAAPFDASNGVGITVSCKDPEGALQFINDMLSQEVQTLRYWGVKGVDYEVDEDGLFYRTEKQREEQEDKDWKLKNWCEYDYFPHHRGMNLDNKNAYNPANQPSEYFGTLKEPMQKLLSAYGVETLTQLLNPSGENEPWFPMWSYSNNWTSETDYGLAKVDMDEVKHEYLPKVVMAKDFDKAWDEYMKVLGDRVDMKVYEDALTAEVKRRVAVAEGKTVEE